MGPPTIPEPEHLEWRVHPYAERRLLGHAALVVIGAAGLAAAVRLHSGLAGFAVSGLLFTSTHSFFLPTRYFANSQGLTVVRLRLRTYLPWRRFRSVRRVGRSLWLSPLGGGWLARVRSFRVDLPLEDRALEAYVRARIESRS